MIAPFTPTVNQVPYAESFTELYEDELPEIGEPTAPGAIWLTEEAACTARISLAMNPRRHYTRDFLWLSPYLRGQKPLPEWVGVDIETEVEDRPDVGPGWRSGLIPAHTAIACIQIEVAGEVFIVHWSPPPYTGDVRPRGNMSNVPGIEMLCELFALPFVWKCIHNAEFEWKFLLNELGWDLVINNVWDTKLGENVLSEGRGFTFTQGKYWIPRKDEKPRKFLKLGDCIQRRYGYQMDKGQDVRTSFMRGDSLTDRQINYGGDDAIWCRMLAEDQYTDMCRLEAAGVRMLTTMRADCEMVEAVGRMGLRGIHVDRAEALKLWAEIQYEISQLTERVRKILWLPGDGDPVLTPKTGKQKVKDGKPVYNLLNLNSEQQMVPRLNAFGVAVPDYKAASLKHFKDHAGVSDILLEKQLDKLSGTYLEPMVKRFIHPKTHTVYVNLNLAVAGTGRLSSSHPNLQTMPTRTKWGKRVKRLFKARPGCALVDGDFSNIELKLIAELFGDENMINAFCANMDLHALIGAVVLYGVTDYSWENLVAQYNVFYPQFKAGDDTHTSARQGGKPVNFGLGYGAGPKELQMIAWRDHNIWWDLDRCKELRRTWLSIWSGVRRYHYAAAEMCTAAAQRGQPVIAETLDGRRRWLDARTGYSAWINHRIQGTSADMTKRAINEMKREIPLILTVHDSITAEVPPEHADQTRRYMQDVMVRAGQYYLKRVPVTVDVKIVDRLGEERAA